MGEPGGVPLVGQEPKRRFQFGLGTLLTLPVCLAGFCAIGAGLGWPVAILALFTVIVCCRDGATLWETVVLLVLLLSICASR